MGDVLKAWLLATDLALANLFNGTEDGIAALKGLIQDGHLISGKSEDSSGGDSSVVTSDMQSDLESAATSAFFAFAIPAVWAAANTPAFVIGSGQPCDLSWSDPNLGETAKATKICRNGEAWYLASPRCANKDGTACSGYTLGTPPGVDKLNGRDWGKLTVEQIILGSINTWANNHFENTGTVSDYENSENVNDLLNMDVTSAGSIRLPICSSNMAVLAWQNWDRVDKDDPNYPCLPLGGVKKCWDITWEDQTTDGSPPVADCQQMVRNVQGTDGTWTTGIGPQRGITTLGKCILGVQNDGVGHADAVRYVVGAGDVEVIVNEAIKRYGGSGKVGAKGHMTCSGEVGGEVPIKWGLY